MNQMHGGHRENDTKVMEEFANQIFQTCCSNPLQFSPSVCQEYFCLVVSLKIWQKCRKIIFRGFLLTILPPNIIPTFIASLVDGKTYKFELGKLAF